MPKSDNIAPSTLRTMSSVMSLERAKPPVRKASEMINIPLVLINFNKLKASEEYQDEEGTRSYFIIQCVPFDIYPVDDPDYIPVHISVGGFAMVNQMNAVNKVEHLPLKITIKVDPNGNGKALYME